MSIRCSIQRLKHYVVLPTGNLCIEAVYCSNGLHETQVRLDEGETQNSELRKMASIEDEPLVVSETHEALQSWLNSYVKEPEKSHTLKLPPVCRFAYKHGKGESPFERSVWEALKKHVPAGQVVTYARLAELANSCQDGEGRRYARAVGQIMRRNPLGLLRPCHRVIPSTSVSQNSESTTANRKRQQPVEIKKDHKFTYGSYAGVAGSTTKRALLDFELPFGQQH